MYTYCPIIYLIKTELYCDKSYINTTINNIVCLKVCVLLVTSTFSLTKSLCLESLMNILLVPLEKEYATWSSSCMQVSTAVLAC